VFGELAVSLTALTFSRVRVAAGILIDPAMTAPTSSDSNADVDVRHNLRALRQGGDGAQLKEFRFVHKGPSSSVLPTRLRARSQRPNTPLRRLAWQDMPAALLNVLAELGEPAGIPWPCAAC
jgi:hypothetical protein